MDPILIIHCAATWGLFGLIWTVQLSLYPLFLRTGRETFPGYHKAHMRRITLVVAPLMFVELGALAWLVTMAGARDPYLLWSIPFLLANWISTAVIQIPLHKKLENEGFDQLICNRLIASNWIRTIAWTIRAALVTLFLIR